MNSDCYGVPHVPDSRVYISQSTDDALGLLEDGIGSVVILVGDRRTRATSACFDALDALAADYDPDHVLFAHVDPRFLPSSVASDGAQTDAPAVSGFPPPSRDGSPTLLCCRDGEILEASVGRQCCVRLRRQVERLMRDDPGPCLLTRLFRFASGA